MNKEQGVDWDPHAYAGFASLRTRPALDLIKALPPLPDTGDVMDLGCGSGAAAAALSTLGRDVHGLDSSETMLAEARSTGLYHSLSHDDLKNWQPDQPLALIFSNAVLHWVGDHDELLPKLVSYLAPGGCLAVQVPNQNHAPSHELWRSLASEFWAAPFDLSDGPSVRPPADYFQLLEPLGELALWETVYYQNLPSSEDGHPVRKFTQSTFARPILEKLDEAGKARLVRAYDDAVTDIYPLRSDGSVLFPFRRLFMTLRRI